MNHREFEPAPAGGKSAERRARDRLQPSLLDRVTDTAPHRSTESEHERSIDGERLRAAVLRDLAWLLNTTNAGNSIDGAVFSRVQSSVLNYGMRPLAGIHLSGLAPSDIEASVREAILRFEPRIEAGSLQVRCLDEGTRAEVVEGPIRMNLLAFEISGRLWSVPHSVGMLLRSELDLETGAVSLKSIERV